MRYLSVCSGIEAASVAWEPLGWVPVAFAEIEKFPAAVLQTRYPHVPNLGDMTKINGADFKGKIDVLVGGTPCQSFSVAGLRGGLDDERGNLALEFVRIADESDPAFVIWENVPGIFSDRGNAFGCFLAALSGENAPLLPAGGRWTNAGYVLGTRRTIAWRVLDAQYFGLAQRRKRVFLVGCPVDGADPRKILFEFDGLRRDSAPSREARAGVAGTLESSLGRSRGAGINPGAITQAFGGNNTSGSIDVSPALNAHGGGSRRLDFESETFIRVATALRAEGFDASEDGTGRQNLVVTPINTQVGLRHQALGERTGLGIGEPGDPAFTLQSAHSHAVCVTPPLTGNQYGDHESREGLLVPMQSPGSVLAFHGSQDPNVSGKVTHPLGTNQGQEVCVMQGRFRGDDGRGYERAPHVSALPSLDTQKVDIVASVSLRGREGGGTAELSGDTATALRSSQGGGDKAHCLQGASVRRLTPVECERLQGFPDEYTAIPWHRIVRDVPLTVLEKSYRKYLKRMKRQGKHPLSFGDVLSCADGPRYKALGNSMAVPVMRWIGKRIERSLKHG